MTLQSSLVTLYERLSSLSEKNVFPPFFVGFDGYVDRIEKVVRTRSGGQRQYYQTIEHMSRHLSTLSGRSGQIELDLQETKLGGNAPIMAHALGSLGLSCVCMGTLGESAIDPVFASMHENCHAVSLAPPAQTYAYEFEDGKLIFSEVSTFDRLSWEYVKKVAGLSKLSEYFSSSGIIALVDWANLPYCTGVWKGILEEVVAPLGKTGKHYFFDLADPSRKPANEVKEALAVISSYREFGKVTLGLNENETIVLWKTLHPESNLSVPANLQVMAESILSYVEIDQLLVHPVDGALICTSGDTYKVQGRVVPQPRILTGGGDNMNAGFCLGLAMELHPVLTCLLGIATSGAYVQNGYSPSRTDLLAYINVWLNGLIEK